MVRVKICGITSLGEARMAVDCGADAVGFLVGLDYHTDDELNVLAAKKIIASLPPFVSSVLVTHKTDSAWVVSTCRRLGCSAVQLHGDFAVDKIPSLRSRLPNVRIIKAIHVVDSGSVLAARRVASFVDAVLLDTRTETRIGGTGLTHDWSISARIARELAVPVILAGGLNPTNIRDAVAAVAPFAVDVNSGVENADGSKSLEKIRSFVSSARSIDRRGAAVGLLAQPVV